MEKIIKTNDEWRVHLSLEAFKVCRQKGTEQPFSGKYDKCADPGVYICACCEHPLFSSQTKFDSGSGWPSFYEVISEDAIQNEVDDSLFMRRTEIICARCDAHLGHVFPDGPDPTGLRYCMNSVALKLVPSGKDD